jgi:hypothetical protein
LQLVSTTEVESRKTAVVVRKKVHTPETTAKIVLHMMQVTSRLRVKNGCLSITSITELDGLALRAEVARLVTIKICARKVARNIAPIRWPQSKLEKKPSSNITIAKP